MSRDAPISQAPTYAYRKCAAAPLHRASLRVHLPCCLFEAAVCCVHCACSASLKCPEGRSEITPLQREAGFREREREKKREQRKRGGVNESGAEAEIRMTADGAEAKNGKCL